MKNSKKTHPPLDEASTIRLQGTVVEHFEHLTDPRVDRTKRHR